MANKDYPSNTSLAAQLAAKGITAKPGVASGGNKATQRAQQFAAGKTYTPAPSKNLAAGNPQMRTSVGPSGQVGLSPARASMGFPNSAPPTSINAPMQSRGAPSPMPSMPGQSSFIPSSFPSGPSASSGAIGGGSFMPERAGLGPMLNDLGRSIGQSFSGERDPSMPMNPQGWPTGDQSRWGAQTNRWGAEQGRDVPSSTPSWLPSLFSLLAQMTGGK